MSARVQRFMPCDPQFVSETVAETVSETDAETVSETGHVPNGQDGGL